MLPSSLDIINPDDVKSLGGLFRERVKRSANDIAYQYFDTDDKNWKSITWQQSADQVAQLQAALQSESLETGDRVAVMMRNSTHWVQFEQAALGLGLVIVPLYTNDRAENIAYVLQDAGVKIMLIEGHEQLNALQSIAPQLDGLVRLLSVQSSHQYNRFARLIHLQEWIDNVTDNATGNATGNNASDDPNGKKDELVTKDIDKDTLATIVYTSGTTGRPKGVMLSHWNILTNTYSPIHKDILIYKEDIFLSFLPLSHMLERMAGYYIPMMAGSQVAFARSVQDLAEDLISIKPTVLISVPRIYERVHAKISAQLEHKSSIARKLFHKAEALGWERFNKPGTGALLWPILNQLVAKKVMTKLGGRLRIAICGGAPLSPAVAKTFIGLGLNLLQGYGLTETSPVICVNTPNNNDPASVGPAMDGIEIKIGEQDELLTRSPSVMLGYWQNPEATQDIIDADGWLHTGDKVRIESDRVYITGRLKEIIVLSNGEKVPPSDMEMAIMMDPLFEQVLVLGEAKPYLSALVVLNQAYWQTLAAKLELAHDDPDSLNSKVLHKTVLERIKQQILAFPGYAQIRQIAICSDPWSIENGLMTPTLKLKRAKIMEQQQAQIETMYKGH